MSRFWLASALKRTTLVRIVKIQISIGDWPIMNHTNHLRILMLLFAAIAFSSGLRAQKTSTWVGDGSDDNWTTAENWDTPEDPNGGDTAIIPSPFGIVLDANRSVSLLDLRGQTGQFIEISGSAQLSVQNGLLWKDSVLTGSGSLNSINNSVFQGVTAFNGWTVNLGGSTTMNAGLMTSSGSVTLGGTVNWGAADLAGPGTYTISGAFVKNTTDANHSSTFDPGNLILSGSLAANQGIIVLQPAAFDPTGAQFLTGTEGRLRLVADNVVYRDAQFKNDGLMDITDQVLGTEESIRFSGMIQSIGTNPVELGTNGKYRLDIATFEGPWLMQGASLKGELTTNGGGFNWRNGDLGPSVTHTGLAEGDFSINFGGAPAPRLLGTFRNQGFVTQNTTLSVHEGIVGTQPEAGKIVLESGSTWNMVGNAGLGVGTFADDREPTLEILSDGTLVHSGTLTSDRSIVGLKTILGNLRSSGGTVRNDAGQLEFIGDGNLLRGNFNVNNLRGLDSKIRLAGNSILDATVGISNGGIFELAESSPGTGLISLTATGEGEVLLQSGTLEIPATISTSPSSRLSIGNTDEDGLGDGGVVMRITSSSSAPTYAIEFEIGELMFSKFARLISSGHLEWARRAIGINLESGESPPVIEANRGQFENSPTGILDVIGFVNMNDISFINLGTLRLSGTGPRMTLGRVSISNSGEWLIEGNGDIFPATGSSADSLDFLNKGILRKTTGSSTASLSVSIDNLGVIESTSGTLRLNGPITQYNPTSKLLTGGTWIARNGGTLAFQAIDLLSEIAPLPDENPDNSGQVIPPPPGEGGSPTIIVEGSGSQILNSLGNPLFSQGGLQVSPGAQLRVSSNGELDLGGDLEVGGWLVGDGTITAPNIVVSNNGSIVPGNSPGTLTLIGDLQMAEASRYLFEASSTGIDKIVVNGDVTLNGFFVPIFLDGFIPPVGTSFTVISADSITGAFQGLNLGFIDDGITFTFENTGTELIATVADAAPSGDFEDWRAENFFQGELADPAISGAKADPDGDGIPNLFEFLAGTRARQTDPRPWTFEEIVAADGSLPGAVELSLRWRDGDPGHDFAVERSDNLESWLSANVQVLSDQSTDGFREITLRATGADAGSFKEFFRLSVVPSK